MSMNVKIGDTEFQATRVFFKPDRWMQAILVLRRLAIGNNCLCEFGAHEFCLLINVDRLGEVLRELTFLQICWDQARHRIAEPEISMMSDLDLFRAYSEVTENDR